ncbi:MAG: hypothetical protein PUB22_03975, partial [Clostridiales bacterium]|nr:hypothetical protein [Clostridiales bacterium]
FPMVVWGQTYLREHNCHPTEIPMSWDFIKNYKLLDDGTRLYSPSGFEKDDAAVIETTADDFDAVTELATDYSQAAQLPLTGYYTKSISDGRTVKVYISEEASVRSYFTVVAVPDGVNTYEFLRREGWIALADEKGEGLFVLEPGTDGWGSVEEETAYVNAAIDYLKKTRNTNNLSTFSTFGEFYLAGYGKAAAPLEAWAAANPIFVISQAYINGESVDEATLETLGNVLYDGSNTSGYDPGLTEDADFRATLEETGIEQIARKDVAVPTMFAGNSYAQSSLAYWLAANDCESNAVDGVYYQKKDSKSLVTQYANSQLDAFAAHGISQVKLASADVKAAEIYDFLATYTRYDNTFAYSNGLFLRLDYTSARVAAQKDAKDGEVLSELSNGAAVLAKSDVTLEGNGTVEIGIMAFADNNNDGQNDPREYLMYIPDGFEGTKLPVLIVSPGNSQTDSIFMDSTLWWQVANKEGILVIIVTETYSSATGVSHANSDKFYESLICMLKEQTNGNQCDIDFNRIYGTGQSGGSMETQGFVRTHPEFYAAAASTSGLAIPREGAWLPEGVGGSMPCFLIAAQSDLGNLMDDLWTSALATDWIEYLFKVNGMEDSDIGSADMPHTSINNNRTRLYTWANGQNINMIQYGYTLLRAHNCHPSEMPILWDFLEHFSFEKDDEGNFTRFYSESAFSENDAVEIITEK